MRIGLTLGGGGARGAAHVGVLMELERLGIRPHLITGTSIGGLVGALAAAGLSTSAMTAFFSRLNISDLFSLSGNVPALTSTSKIEKLLENTLGRRTFAELQIPLAVVTTDLVSRKIVVIDEGDLITALLATIAVPIALPPVQRGDQILVDGGLLNNTPFDIARARGATFVIAVDLTNTTPFATPPASSPTNSGLVGRALTLAKRRRTWQILSAVSDIITSQSFNARLAISQPDVLLQPKLENMGLFDFHRWEEALAAGITAVQESEETLLALKSKRSGRI